MSSDDEATPRSEEPVPTPPPTPPPPIPSSDAADEVAVGSIAHILRTTFADLYQAPRSRRSTVGSTVGAITPAEETLEEGEGEGEGEEGAEAKEDDEQEATTDAPAEPPAQTEEVPPEGEGEVESPETDEEEQVDDVPYDPNAPGAAEVLAIDEDLRNKCEMVDQLIAYLKQQHEEAELADRHAEQELKVTGLIVKEQIPIGPSNLRLEEEILSQYGTFGNNLLTARELLKANLDACESRAGLGPNPVNATRRANDGDVPGFMRDTSATPHEGKTVRFASVGDESELGAVADITEHDSRVERDATTVSTATTKPKTSNKKEERLTAEELDVNTKVLERMNNRLKFLRNPRFDKSSTSTGNKGLIGTGGKVGQLFISEPPSIMYTDYGVGSVLDMSVLCRNVSAVSRHLRILPPSTQYFSLVSVLFPSGSDGMIAPGMSCRVTVRFVPDSSADYEDVLHCVTENETFSIPIIAHRPPPSLTLPQVLDAGCCLVGNQTHVVLSCANYGGAGRFRLLDSEDWPDPKNAHAKDNILRMDPFVLSPPEFALRDSESMDFEVWYTPPSVGSHAKQFVMVCDNCQVKTFDVIGVSCLISFDVVSINGQQIDMSKEHAVRPSTILFEALAAGASSTNLVEIRNNTPQDLEFSWQGPPDEQVVAGSRRGQRAPEAFSISPRDGVFPANSCVTFTCTFAPKAVSLFRKQMSLVVHDVPPQSVPGKEDMAPKPNSHLADVPCLDLNLCGASTTCDVLLDPPIAVLDGMLLPDKEYETKVKFSNCSDAAVDFSWGMVALTSHRELDAPPPAPEFLAEQADRAMFDLLPPDLGVLTVEPEEGVLQPHETRDLVLRFLPRATGFFHVRAACAVVGGPPGGLQVQLAATVMGPQLRVSCPEVDFGLMVVAGSAERTFTLNNPNDAPVSWAFKDPSSDENAAAAELLMSPAQRPHSRASRVSRISLNSSVTSGSKGQQRQCRLRVEPLRGIVPPHGSIDVTVACTAGEMPQRLRTVLTCNIDHGRPQMLRVRGEVQAPKVFLSTTEIPLGTTYVGVVVQRTVQLTNLSNLLAHYKWDCPEGPSKKYDVTFEPPTGTLGSKATQEILITYTPRAAGKVDTLFACKIKGMAVPLGFNLTTLSKALVLSYEILPETAPLPPSVLDECREDEVDSYFQPKPPPRLVFGETALFQRKKLRLCIRNCSAIGTPFRAHVRKFPTAQPRAASHTATTLPSTAQQSIGGRTHTSMASSAQLSRATPESSAFGGGTMGGGRSTVHTASAASGAISAVGSGGLPVPPSRPMLLGATHEHTQKFTSNKGQEYVFKAIHEDEDSSMLSDGNGVAFRVEPECGFIGPWESMELIIYTYNNMPGQFFDDLLLDVEQLPTVRFPLSIDVGGCPLAMVPDCVGLELRSPPQESVLTWGSLVVNNNPVTKRIQVRNSGPIGAMVSFKVLAMGLEDEPLVAVSLNVSKSGKVRVRIRHHEPDENPPLFTISPERQLVDAHRTEAFMITVATLDQLGYAEAVLIADAEWLYPADEADSLVVSHAGSPSPTLALTSVISAVSKFSRASSRNSPAVSGLDNVRVNRVQREDRSPACIRLHLRALAVDPVLHLDKMVHRTGKQHLKFTVWSTHPPEGPEHCRTATLTNRLTTPLTFSLRTTPPFQIVRTHCLAKRHPLSLEGTAEPLRPPSAGGHVFTLPQDENVSVEICYVPPPFGGGMSTGTKTLQLKREDKGELVISYANGSSQSILLNGEVYRPMITLSPPEYHFHFVHTEEFKVTTLFLSNPTAVDAQWRIRHIPAPTIQHKRSITKKPPPPSIDDPTVFVFSKTNGLLVGPTMPLSSAGARLPDDQNRTDDAVFRKPRHDERQDRAPEPISVTFSPAIAGLYKCRFRFEVVKGESFDVVLQGTGTYSEEARIEELDE